MCGYVIYSDAETSGQLYSPPPQPLFTAPANHISSIIHFYGTHRITITITKITAYIKRLYCCYEYEWMSEWVNAFLLYSVFFSRGLKQACIYLQMWLQLILIHGYVCYVLFRIIFQPWEFLEWKSSMSNSLAYLKMPYNRFPKLCTFILQLKVILSLSGFLSVWWFCAWKWARNVYLHLLPYQNIFYLWKATIKFYLASHIMLQRAYPAATGKRIGCKIMTKTSVSTLYFVINLLLAVQWYFIVFKENDTNNEITHMFEMARK